MTLDLRKRLDDWISDLIKFVNAIGLVDQIPYSAITIRMSDWPGEFADEIGRLDELMRFYL